MKLHNSTPKLMNPCDLKGIVTCYDEIDNTVQQNKDKQILNET